jgi:fumarate reductase flavoprotein subunit
MVTVAGAGMAGLVTAARLRELGVTAVVREKGTRPGGSMLLSSCVIWRHREWADFRRECPNGDERLQRLVWERLDDALDWLMSLGAEPIWNETGNPLTSGKRFDPRELTDCLVRAGVEPSISSAGELPLRLEKPELRSEKAQPSISRGGELPLRSSEPVILCTGGFAASGSLVARHVRPAAPLRLRANPWSTGDGLAHALAGGGALTAGMDEFYGRNMPDADWGEPDFVSASQLYGRFARVFDQHGNDFFAREAVSWSETNLVQATARRPRARAYYVLDDMALAQRVRDRTVSDIVAAAPPAARVPLEALPFEPPPGARIAVRVVAAITHTIGGIRVDDRARVLRSDGRLVEGLYAAGVDAGGVATGGYASGLAQALVQGLVAAEDVAARA